MREIFKFDLQLFAEGGAANGSAGTGGTGEGGSGLTGDFDADFDRYFGSGTGKAHAAGVQKEDPQGVKEDEGKGSVTAPEAPAHAADEQNNEEPKPGDPEREFDELTKGKYKEQFGKRVQGIINQRFKDGKQQEEKISGYEATLAPLYDKYGVAEGDLKALTDAINNDSGNFIQQAMKANMSVDAYRDTLTANREKSKREKAEKEQALKARQEAQMKETFSRWEQEEKTIKEKFPSFSLREELQQNEAFRQAVESGVPLQIAYYGTRFDDLASSMVASAVQNYSKKAAETIAGNMRRPTETGGGGAGAGVMTERKSAASMSENDINSILERVARGERIVL